MRNEAKLNVFKQAGRLGNFKNIALSVAHRHQRLLCYELSPSSFLLSPLECGPCNESIVLKSQLHSVQFSLQNLFPSGISEETTIASPRWVKVSGIILKPNCYLILGCDGLHPIFARVVKILVLLDVVILLVFHYTVDYFDDH